MRVGVNGLQTRITDGVPARRHLLGFSGWSYTAALVFTDKQLRITITRYASRHEHRQSTQDDQEQDRREGRR